MHLLLLCCVFRHIYLFASEHMHLYRSVCMFGYGGVLSMQTFYNNYYMCDRMAISLLILL